MEYLKRFDDGIARGEAALATLFLLSMILAASVQAIFRNIAGFDVAWANAALEHLTWIDPFLQKGTLWLAFLGASLATKEGRHIGVDLLPRLAPRKGKLLMRGITGVGSSIVAFYLARAFWSAVLVNAEERPATMEVWADSGAIHVCDATAQQVADASLELPTFFCGVRGALESIGVPVETPAAALQLIVPVMFVVMAVRLMANGVGAFLKINQPPSPDEEEGEAGPRPSDAGEEPAADSGSDVGDAGSDSSGGDDSGDADAEDSDSDSDDAGDSDSDEESSGRGTGTGSSSEEED